MKINDSVFSRNQFVISVVPTNEFDHTNANINKHPNSHQFLRTGILFFEIAIVNSMIVSFFVTSQRNKKKWIIFLIKVKK